MYKNYIFDLYGTLIDISTNERSPKFWTKMALFYSFNNAKYQPHELKKLYLEKAKYNADLIKNSNYPDFPIENVFRSLYEHKGVNPTDKLVNDTALFFRISSMSRFNLYDGVIETLEKLKSNNKRVYLLSNAQRIFTSYEMNYFDLDKYFDDIFLSSDHYICKPDYKFYNKLLINNNLNVKESIMIGNDPIADIKGAQAVGLDTLYINSNLSPKINLEDVYSTYKIKDGNVYDICKIVLKNNN